MKLLVFELRIVGLSEPMLCHPVWLPLGPRAFPRVSVRVSSFALRKGIHNYLIEPLLVEVKRPGIKTH